MALITTNDELKAVLRVSNLNDVESLPDFDTAGEHYIKPALGATLYDALQTAYTNNTLSPLQAKLLKKVQKPLAAFAVIDDAGIMNILITDSGFRQQVTESQPAAMKWQFNEGVNSLKTRAYNSMEELYNFLLTNKTELAWSDADRKKFLITNGLDFTEYYTLFQPLRTYHLLKGSMTKAEDKYVKPLIGDTFFSSLKTLANPSTEEKEVIRLLKLAVAHLTIKHACETLPIRKWDGGFTVLNAAADRDAYESSQGNAPDALVETERKAADRDGQDYLKQAVAYLNEKASNTVFASFFSSDYYEAPPAADVIEESRNANSKIFRF